MTMMALGIPGDLVTAIMLGALIMHNVAPSPTFISTQPVLAYGIMLAYLIAHGVTVAWQAGFLRLFVLVSLVPMYRLAAVVLFFCAVGIFNLNNVIWDLWVLLGFGLLGYLMYVFKFPITPMILGVVLNDQAEINWSGAGHRRQYPAVRDTAVVAVFPHHCVFLLIFPWYQAARTGRAGRWATPVHDLIRRRSVLHDGKPVRAAIGAG